MLQGIFAGKKLDDVDLDRVVANDLTIQGALGSPGVWTDVRALIESGRIDPGSLVTSTLPLGEYQAAIEQVRQPQGIKTIVSAGV